MKTSYWRVDRSPILVPNWADKVREVSSINSYKVEASR